MAVTWLFAFFLYPYVRSVEDRTLMSIFDQFRFSFGFSGIAKIGPNRCTQDSCWYLVAFLLILGYDDTASSNNTAPAARPKKKDFEHTIWQPLWGGEFLPSKRCLE